MPSILMTIYKVDICSSLSAAWKLARANIEMAQASQKSYYDRSSKSFDLKPGDRVMVFMPAERKSKTWKLSRPFHGPYRVLHATDTNVEVRLIDHPEDDTMFVHLNRVHRCYPQQGEAVWKGPRDKRRKRKQKAVNSPQETDFVQPYTGPVTRSCSVDYHGERGRRYLELRTGGDRFSVQRTTTCSLTLLTRMRLTDSSKTGRTCALMK